MAGDGGRGDNGASIGASLKENDVDGQISEDEKMEKFYALIKNYKEAGERRRMELERQSTKEEGVGVGVYNDKQGRRKRKRTMESGDRTASNWIPAFKWEDFGENSQIKFRNCPVKLPASFGGDCIAGRLDDPSPSQAEVEGGGLDLRLRL